MEIALENEYRAGTTQRNEIELHLNCVLVIYMEQCTSSLQKVLPAYKQGQSQNQRKGGANYL